jgi:thioredoxin-like negative regulator of GroEL
MDTLGWILHDGGQIERAANLLHQTHQAAPDNPDIAFHYAVALHRRGDDDCAKGVLPSILKDGKEFPTKSEGEVLSGAN